MPNYTLKITFTSDQLKTLLASETKVVLAKTSQGSNPNVVWQAFLPQQNNLISWNDQYGIYASHSPITNGTVLNQLAATPAGIPVGNLYSLQNSSAILGPITGGQSGSFAIANHITSKDFLTFGLYLNAVINQSECTGNAISATAVSMSETLYIKPPDTIHIWLASQVMGNTVLTPISSPVTQIKCSKKQNTIALQYDAVSGKFLNTASIIHHKSSIQHTYNFL